MYFGIIIAALLLVIVMVIAEREIYYFDGVHLGPKIHGWLYNKWAAKYDSDKQKSQANDGELLILPLLKKLKVEYSDLSEILVLDIATGTGRFPFAHFQQPEFTGHIIGLDISFGMLLRASENLAPYKNRIELLHQSAMPLPFPDNTFSVVSCLESIELMPDIHLSLNEIARVLRPGGVLVISRCTKRWGYDTKCRKPEEFRTLLQTSGFDQVEIMPWWKWFDRVLAYKPGRFALATQRKLIEILKCSNCGMINWANSSSQGYQCQKCGTEIKTSPEGIVSYSK
jgi:ubiquinone/menaquinone biosynthesis C-methylase UbiE